VDAWADSSLRPERATLVVVSSIEPDPELWSTIEGHFGGWSGSGKSQPPVRVDPPPPAARRLVLVDQPGAVQPLLRVGIASPRGEGRDGPALDTLATYLSWHLQHRLRFENGVTYGARAGWSDPQAGGALEIDLAVSSTATPAALRTILDAVQLAAEGRVPENDLLRARWQVARRMALGFDTVRSSAAELGRMASQGLPPDYWERYPASLEGVDAARVQAAARALAIGKEAIVVVGDAARLRPALEAAGFHVDKVVPAPAASREGAKAGG
jgi:zinc protease